MTELDIAGTVNINDLPFATDRSRAWRELRAEGEAVASGEEIVLTSAEAVEFAARSPRSSPRHGPSTASAVRFRSFRSPSIRRTTPGSAACWTRSSAPRRWRSASPSYAGRRAN